MSPIPPVDGTAEATKHLVDLASVVVMIGAIIQYLPAIAALFTIVWTAIRIWETPTVRGWFYRGTTNKPAADYHDRLPPKQEE